MTHLSDVTTDELANELIKRHNVREFYHDGREDGEWFEIEIGRSKYTVLAIEDTE